jgi:hypothetical protein
MIDLNGHILQDLITKIQERGFNIDTCFVHHPWNLPEEQPFRMIKTEDSKPNQYLVPRLTGYGTALYFTLGQGSVPRIWPVLKGRVDLTTNSEFMELTWLQASSEIFDFGPDDEPPVNSQSKIIDWFTSVGLIWLESPDLYSNDDWRENGVRQIKAVNAG